MRYRFSSQKRATILSLYPSYFSLKSFKGFSSRFFSVNTNAHYLRNNNLLERSPQIEDDPELNTEREKGQVKQGFARKWEVPKQGLDTGVQIYNSLARAKVPFIIEKKEGPFSNVLTWYSCGPTVYDWSHLGHARNYVCLDIINRLLQYFININVFQVMGITDIDDKIIQKSSIEFPKIINEHHDNHISKINLNAIDKCSLIARKYEKSFINDMLSMDVKPPTFYSRVTEHIEEIVHFISKIESKGFAYTTSSGVYFDCENFGENYGKLSPYTKQQNAENIVNVDNDTTMIAEKKDPRDFALWKFTKNNTEPQWPSKWGYGRPGWHIECSAMIDKYFGAKLDLHSGGIDLAFPHHNNEIAQSEAANFQHCQNRTENHNLQWCNYFIHVGHLHIQGMKMSKSLKNFVSIGDFLKSYTANQFRIFCLVHKYNTTIEYSEDRMREIQQLEKKIIEFYLNMQVLSREISKRTLDSSSSIKTEVHHRWSNEHTAFHRRYLMRKTLIRERICDDFDTPGMMNLLMDQISDLNATFPSSIFLSVSSSPMISNLILEIVSYIQHMFETVGLRFQRISYDTCASYKHDIDSDSKLAENVLNALANFRTQVRNAALSTEANELKKEILEKCDELRDGELKKYGVRFEDHFVQENDENLRGEVRTVWKLVDPKLEELSLELEKEKERKRMEEKNAMRVEKAKIDPKDYFRKMLCSDGVTALYAQFDERGIPTHDKDGNELSKSAKKKLNKEYERQVRIFEKHLQQLTPQ